MSRTAAATTAGRAIGRTATPAAPRRVSGPAGPPRRDPNGRPPASRDDARSQARQRSSARAESNAQARAQSAARGNAGAQGRRDAGPRRAPRARIDPSALAYGDGGAVAVATPLPRPSRVARPSPRRRSGPVARPQRLAYGGVAIASRMANVAIDVSTSRLMDRLVRSRVWIGVIAVVLIGIVAMQVSMLKLNAGISDAVTTAGTLEQSNAAMRRDISTLSAGDRIEPLAAAEGFVMPAPDGIGFLDARGDRGAAGRAARRMTKPDPALAGYGGAVNADDQLGDGSTPADPAPTVATPSVADASAPAAASTGVTTPPADPAATTSTAAPAGTPPAPTASPPAATTSPVAQTTAPPVAATGTSAATGAIASGGAQATTQTP